MGPEPAAFDRAWLQARIELLRRYCLPSVAAQSAQQLEWLLLCDRSTDGDTLATLRAHACDVAALRVIETDAHYAPVAAISAALRPNIDVLITTRLDSDDALADRYLEAVQDYARPFERSEHDTLLVNFPRGYRLDARTATVYETRMPNSPFHSLLERPRRAAARTVLHGNHAFLHEDHVTHQDESLPAWLQVVHGGNLFNREAGSGRGVALGGGLPGFTLGER